MASTSSPDVCELCCELARLGPTVGVLVALGEELVGGEGAVA
jgi:hypothetical protein